MNKNIKSINDNDFEMLLSSSLPVPDGEITNSVTPFKSAFRKIIFGLSLSLITLNIGFLNLLLPAIGAVTLLLGLKPVRRENKSFYGCFIISLIQTALILPTLISSSTIYSGEINASLSALTFINIGLDLVMLILFSLGLHNVFKKADLPYNKGYCASLIIWYLVICFLAFINYNGIIVPAVMILSYIFILRSLYKLSASLEKAGFVIELTPSKISDKAVALLVSAVLLITTACGYAFFSQYEMNWKEYTPSISKEAEDIKENLISLGFPEHILDDLKEEEILSLKDAKEVYSEVNEHAFNKGREVTETRYENGTTHHIIHTEHDIKELKIIGIAVKLPSEKERWKIIQHFEWVYKPKYFGTESIQLWTADKTDEGWHTTTEVTGQLLYSKNGKNYASPYYSIENESYISESILGKDSRSDIFLKFSLPKDGERQRGYLTYEIESEDSTYLIDEWINYTHQCSPFQYPVMTAKERRMKDMWNKSGVFFTVQDAIQF